MTWEELLTACKRPGYQASLPMVRNTRYDKIGHVTVIKCTEGFKGCAVRYLDYEYDLWFHEENGTDRRKQYMADLELHVVECKADFQPILMGMGPIYTPFHPMDLSNVKIPEFIHRDNPRILLEGEPRKPGWVEEMLTAPAPGEYQKKLLKGEWKKKRSRKK